MAAATSPRSRSGGLGSQPGLARTSRGPKGDEPARARSARVGPGVLWGDAVSHPRIVLYGPRAPLTEKVARGLRLKRLRFELVEPASPEDYARLSPETGLLPLLELDGVRIPDSAAILDFLDDR